MKNFLTEEKKIMEYGKIAWKNPDMQRISFNVGFTLTFLLVASSSQAKMCPERLPEPANAGPQAGGRRASLARSGRARDPTKWSRAQQVKLVVRSRQIKTSQRDKDVELSLVFFRRIFPSSVLLGPQ